MAINAPQRFAIEQPLDWQRLDLSGKNLIEASAGTGKTYTLVLLVMRLILERELPLGSILLSTFTEAATAELRARVSARIEDAFRAALPTRDSEHRTLELGDPLHDYLQRRWQTPVGRSQLGSGKLSRRERDLRLLRAAMLQSGEMAVKTLHGFCHFVLNGISDASGSGATKALVDTAWLNEQAIDDAIRRRFIDVQALSALQADSLDRYFLNDLRRSLRRILMYGRLPMRAVEVPDVSVYAAARAELFTAQFTDLLHAELQSGLLTLRADAERALAQLVRAFKGSAHRALPYRALKRLAGNDSELVSQRHKKPLSSFVGLARLRDFARYAMAQRQVQFGDMLYQLSGELRRMRSERLQARDAITFDSMIENLAARLDPIDSERSLAAQELAASIRRRFPVALIDEFQDTDEQQWAILRAIYGEVGGLILVGDPKQAIYRFRGSDVHTFIRAKQHCACFYLNQNFRARPSLLAALTYFYQRVDDAFFSPDVRFRAPDAGRSDALGASGAGAQAALQFIESTAGTPIVDACQHLAQRIHAASTSGKDLPKVAMLLARRLDVHLAQRLLLTLGVSANSGVREQIIESPLATCLRVVFPALLDPNHIAAIRDAWVQMGKCQWFDAHAQAPGRLLEWATVRLQRWQHDGVAALVLDLAKEIDPQSWSASSTDTVLRWESDAKQLAEYLAEIWSEIAPARSMALSQAAFQRNAKRLLPFLQPQAHSDPTQLGVRRAARSSVQLLTVHAAKGLEFDEVYLPSLQFFHSPDQRVAIVASADGLVCDVGSTQFAEALAEEARESLRERLRLQYVALTRARHQLYVHFKPSKANAKENSLDWHLTQAAPAMDEYEDFADQLQRSDDGGTEWRQGLDELCHHFAIASSLWQVPQESIALASSLPESPIRTTPLAMPTVLIPRAPCSRLSFSSLTRSPHESAAATAFVEQLAEVSDRSAVKLLEPAEAHPEIAALAAYKGPGFGQALHTLFEWALTRALMPTQAEISDCMAKAAMQPPLQNAEQLNAVEALIVRVLRSPMQPPSEFDAPLLRLAELSPHQCLVELGFHIPLSGLSLPELAGLGETVGLGKLFVPETEAGFAHVDGALVGFIDLIYQHAGRFYVLDYKSNFLGSGLSDYRADALLEAMGAHFYHLQHLIYALALHRYLRASLPGYSYANHFGGVHYLFVRAFGLASEPNDFVGDYYYRAPEQLINSLDRLFAG